MNIVVGVSGGIAAYKTVSLVRLLVEAGHEVHVIPTAEALRFVGQPTWEALSQHPVTTSVHDDVPEVRHVALGQRADVVVIAPATANTMANMAAGIANDLLGTTVLATRAPVLIAPAMHTEMWLHPATQHNLSVLRARGVEVIGPETGRLTGDDSGPGRMSEAVDIAARVAEVLARVAVSSEFEQTKPPCGEPSNSSSSVQRGILHGERVLVSAGGTREPIDPVRFIGNRSSGRQGVALAVAAAERGAKVVLLAANIEAVVLAAAESHPGIRVVPVGTAAELEAAAVAAAPNARVVVMAAAVADYRVDAPANEKMRKELFGGDAPVLRLVQTRDVLAGLAAARRPGQVIVGFAAETVSSEEELLQRGRSKAARKATDLLAVNAVGWDEGFEHDVNAVHIIDAAGEIVSRASGSKRDVAEVLLDAIEAELQQRA